MFDNTTYMLYNGAKGENMNNRDIKEIQNVILDYLRGKLGDFYLGGGTALSKVYFQHRTSVDLDFFTHTFNRKNIVSIIDLLSRETKSNTALIEEHIVKDMVKVMVYNINLKGFEGLKIDFIEDWLELINPLNTFAGIPVLSLEDIYLRKIYAVTGAIKTKDIVGRIIFSGGREEAKDFYDIYYLSYTFRSLSDFAIKYLQPTLLEGLIRWFRTYNRLEIKTGLLDMRGRKEIDFAVMEKHFKREIDKIIEKEIGI